MRRVLAIAGAAAALLAVGAWKLVLQPNILLEVAYYNHMQRIGDGIIAFNMAQKRMPRDLDEVVLAGHLPREGSLYSNPLAHGTPESAPLPFRDCEFELAFFPDRATIAIPEAVYSRRRYSALPADSRIQTIRSGVRLVPQGG